VRRLHQLGAISAGTDAPYRIASGSLVAPGLSFGSDQGFQMIL
jgi:hypothetical protein